MSDDYLKHELAKERQENNDRLVRERAREAEARKAQRQTEAQLGELEAMRLQHCLLYTSPSPRD